MIRVRNLSKSYGPTLAVDDISFEISAGEVVGFLGPNGAGKSTTLRVITGFLGSDKGSVEIDDVNLRDDPEAAKAKIGYLPENNPLYEDMTVVEYLRFVGEMRGMEKGRLRENVRRNIERYGLKEVVGKDIGELSKGFRQRVGLAQASLDDPPIMLLDEPTNGLDPNQIVEIRNLIKEIGKTKTVVVSSHNLGEVAASCSRILIINKGKIVADGTPDSLGQKNAGALLHLHARGAGDVRGKLRAVPGVREIKSWDEKDGWIEAVLSVDAVTASGESIGERVFDAAVANGWKLGELRTEHTSLEDVFTQLTKD